MNKFYCRKVYIALAIILSLCLLSTVSAFAAGGKKKKGDKKDKASEEMAAVVDKNAPIQADMGKHHLCESEVYYYWQRELKSEDKDTPPKKETFKVLHQTIDESRLIQEEAKEALAARLEQAKSSALTECKTNHENYGSCLSGKLKRNRPAYQRMDFTSRAAFMSAIKDDCALQSGTCDKSETTEIKCRILSSPDLEPPAPEAAEDEGDGKKDKKKKKK
jgi:hypothetical protein